MQFEIVTPLQRKNSSFAQEDSSARPAHYEFIWLFSGTGSITIGGHQHQLTAQAMFLLSPGTRRDLVIKSDADGVLLYFTSEFLPQGDLPKSIAGIGGRPALSIFPLDQFDEDSAEEMKDLTMKMLRETQRESRIRMDILQHLLHLFLVYVSHTQHTEPSRSTSRREKAFIENFLCLVQTQYQTMRTVNDFASTLCITPSYLNHLVKKNTGYSAKHHIQQNLISKAKVHAMYSDLSLKEVADVLGFRDSAHFSKFFKAFSGTNFSAFQRLWVSPESWVTQSLQSATEARSGKLAVA
jgi:AraC family transcriptional activator of pobA